MIPEGWDTKTLSDIASVQRGKFSARPRNDPKYYGGDIPFVQTGDVSASGKHLIGASQTLNELGLGVSRMFPRETILITIAANIGDTTICDYEVAFPDSVVGINVKPSTDTEWLYYLLQTKKQKLDSVATQNAQKNINLAVLRPLVVQTPPYVEQKKIAEILSTWDQAIETTEKLIANSERQKKALMQQLLTGKKRLPGFNEEWETKELSKLFHFKKGKGLSKGKVVEDGDYECLLYGELYTHYSDVVRDVKSRTNHHEGLPSKAGDVLIPASTTTSGIDLANATAVLKDGILLSGDINILRPKNLNVAPRFIARLLTHIEKFKLARMAQGITIIHLYGRHLKDIAFDIPPIEEQIAISNIIDEADADIEKLNSKLENLKQEKYALMQQLLTGKRRVKIDEEMEA